MKLSEKQALILLDVLKWSLRIQNADNEIGWDYKTRNDLLDEIINQQSMVPKELDP